MTTREPRRCSVPGCGRIHHARGWCVSHYQRDTLHGRLDSHIPIGGYTRHHIPAGSYQESGNYRSFMANVACWTDPHKAATTLIANEIRDELRDFRDSSITAWNGTRWELIR